MWNQRTSVRTLTLTLTSVHLSSKHEPQTGPLLQVVRDRSDHLRHENLGEVGHGLAVSSGAAGRKTNEIWAVDETFTAEVSNARVNTGESSVHDHDRTNEDVTEKGGNREEGKESLYPPGFACWA